MASYDGIDRIKDQRDVSALDVIQTVHRTSDMPLDSTEVFESLTQAQKYARGEDTGNIYQSGTYSYVGQKIVVVDKELSSVDAYTIADEAGTLVRTADQRDIDSLAESISYNKSFIDTMGIAVARNSKNTLVEIGDIVDLSCNGADWTVINQIGTDGVNASIACADSDGVTVVFGTSYPDSTRTATNCARILTYDGTALSAFSKTVVSAIVEGSVSAYTAESLSTEQQTAAGHFLNSDGVELALSGNTLSAFSGVTYHKQNWYFALGPLLLSSHGSLSSLAQAFNSWDNGFSYTPAEPGSTEVSDPDGFAIETLKSIGETLYICAKMGGLWKCTADGRLTRMLALDAVREGKPVAIYGVDTIGNTFVAATDDGIKYSDDAGKSWRNADTESVSFGGKSSIASSGKLIVAHAADTGAIEYSDNGKNFYQALSGSIPVAAPGGKVFYDSGIWYKTGGQDGIMWFSYNGKTWWKDDSHSITTENQDYANCIATLNGGVVFGMDAATRGIGGISQSGLKRKTANILTDLSVSDTVQKDSDKVVTSDAVFNALSALSVLILESV